MAEQKSKQAGEKEKTEQKAELEREYIIPLRAEILKVSRYKRAKRAVSFIKIFLAKHMKVENKDTNKIKLDKLLNEEIWFRGIKNPLHKIKVRAVKNDGMVYAELAEMSDYTKFKKQKLEKRANNVKKTEIKHEEKKKESTEEQKQTEKEKEVATAEAEKEKQKIEAKQQKHSTQKQIKHEQKTQPRRMALQK
jgi:large subunit ribosomal protein L31e